MIDLNEILKVFWDSRAEAVEQIRKAELAMSISESLGKLATRVEKIVTNLECEYAVFEAQYIINH